MKFEYDPVKSASNKIKHGIDFEEAQSLWQDEYRVYLRANCIDEPRFLMIGKNADTLWTAVVTPRSDAIRIISVRRARSKEEQIYEQC